MRKPGGDDAILHRDVGRRQVLATYRQLVRAFAALLLLGMAGTSHALGITASSDSASPGSFGISTISIQTDGVTTDTSFGISFNPAVLTPNVTPLNGATCTAGAGTVAISVSDAMPLTSKNLCIINFDVAAGAADGVYPLQITTPTCSDSVQGMPTICAPLTNGSITVITPGALQCPQTILAGNNQSGPPGSTLPQQLVIRALITGSPKQPPDESFIWEVRSGSATIVQNGSTFYSHPVGYSSLGGDMWQAIDSIDLALGATLGAVLVTGTTEGCGTPEAMFNLTIAPDAAPNVSFSPDTTTTVLLNNGSGSITATSNADGSGTSANSTTTVNSCSISGGGASSFGAPVLTPNPITFVGNTPGTGTIGLTCTQGEFDALATLSCAQSSPMGGAIVRNWSINCLSLPTAPPQLAYSPAANGTVNFTGVTTPGSTGQGRITISPSGGSGGGSNGTTLFDNCAISGTDATAFAVTSTLPITFMGSSTTPQNLDLDCVSGSSARNATLTCDETQSDSPGAPRSWTLSCPAGSSVVRTMTKVSGDGQSGFPRETLTGVAVQLDDSSVGGPVPNQSVSFEVSSGDATFAGGGIVVAATSNAQGVATSPGIVLGTTPGFIVITASTAGFESQRFNLILRSPGTMSAVSGDNQVGTSGQAGLPLVIALTDNGSPLAGEQITWRVVSGSGVTLGSTSTVTDAGGQSQIAITFTAAGASAVIEARSAHGATFTFHVSTTGQAGSPILTVVSGGGQTGPVGSQTDNPIVFQFLDATGAPVEGAQLDFRVIAGSATPTAPNARTDAAGRASVALRFGSTAGQVTLEATNANVGARVTAIATSFVPGFAPASGDNQTAPAGTALPQPLVVAIRTPPSPTSAKGLGGVQVTWSVLAGGGTLTTATTTTNASGQSSNTYVLGAAPGANRVQATIAGVGSVVFNSTANAPQNATLDIVSGNNQSLPTNQDSAALVVRLHTPDGTAVSGACVSWVGASGVTVSADSTTTDSDGRTSITARVGLPGAATVTATPCQSSTGAVTFQINGAVANLPVLTQAQETVATAIDNACPALFRLTQSGQALSAAQQDLLARCSEVVVGAGTQPGGVATALDAMVADESQSQRTAALAANKAQFANVTARLLALRNGVRGGWNANGLAIAGPSGTFPLSFLPSMILAAAGEDEKKDEVGKDFSRLGFFATGTIGNGKRDDGANSPGFKFDTYGLTAGVDYRYSDSFVFGAALGYNHNDTDISRDRGGLEVQGWSVSGYGTFYKGESLYLDGVLSFGRNTFDLSRRIRYQLNGLTGGVTQVDQLVTASPDGDQRSFGISAGRDFNKGAWSIGPYGRMTWSKIGFDSYTERASNPSAAGAGLVATVMGRDITSLQGVLGGKLSYTKSVSFGVLIPHLQAEYLHEFRDDPVNVVTFFANDPTRTPIVIAGERTDPDYFNIGLGLSAILANGRSAFIYYEHRAGERMVTQDSIALGLRLEF